MKYIDSSTSSSSNPSSPIHPSTYTSQPSSNELSERAQKKARADDVPMAVTPSAPVSSSTTTSNLPVDEEDEEAAMLRRIREKAKLRAQAANTNVEMKTDAT